MNVPNPLPLSEAWSPMGYQVVQVADETTAKPAQAPAPPVPRSPLGYQIVKVSEEATESAPADLPAHLRMPRIRRRLAQRPKTGSSGSYMLPFVAIGGACFLGFLIVASIVISRATAPHVRIDGFNGGFRQEALIPAEFQEDAAIPIEPVAMAVRVPGPASDKPRALPAGPAKGEPKGDCAQCVAGVPGAAPGGSETFGTSVRFVRNPDEAFRLAREQRKLTCLLHVAGNFEDARFT
jgi:hypothetical protein